jgi:prephenate dehydrogenase
MGGSLAKAFNKNEISNEIYAYDIDQETIDFATANQLIKGGNSNLSLFEDVFDLIIIASPLNSYEEVFYDLWHLSSPQSLIIDIGSLKSFIDEILPKNLAKNFIACHPIAGSEKNGFENSDSEIFNNKKLIICPNKNNQKELLEKTENLFKEIGCNIEYIEAESHDEIYALVSHLPQFLSFLSRDFSPKNISDEFFQKAFRLDNSSPEIWSDIFELNDVNLEKFYLVFFENLERNFEKFVKQSSPFETKPSEIKFDERFLEENFSGIFIRALFVKSYLEIPTLENFKTYAGTGFQDFTSLIEVLNYDSQKLKGFLEANRAEITKIFNSLR